MTNKKRRKLVAKAVLYRSLFQSEQRRRRRYQEAAAKLCREVAALREANANLRVERDAADHLLGVAMDDLLGGEKALA
jgi:chromosome condensin MukBEF ATPase and DNA-binding subunit MukB